MSEPLGIEGYLFKQKTATLGVSLFSNVNKRYFRARPCKRPAEGWELAYFKEESSPKAEKVSKSAAPTYLLLCYMIF